MSTFASGAFSDRICVDEYVTTLTINQRDHLGGVTISIRSVEGESHDERLQRFKFKMMEVPHNLVMSSCQLELNHQGAGEQREFSNPTKPFDETMGTGSSQSLQLAALWLKECLRYHMGCNSSVSMTPWYPTRLLDLRGQGLLCERIRLIITYDSPPIGPYATLSHCWGQADFIKLQRSTIHQFCQEIEVEDMPKTFQEAIMVCRELQIRYLWIDSLCIMQDKDDLTDWVHESSLMNSIYGFSRCNISASDALDGTCGLFRDHNTRFMDQTIIKATLENQDGVLVTKDHYAEEGSYWATNVTESVVNNRGWVLQERIMTPRVLHFAHDQLFWECREQSASEKYPHGVPGSFSAGAQFKANLDHDLYVAKAARGELDNNSVACCYGAWEHLLFFYTRTELSWPTDKLVAISGMAKSLGTALGDTYVAGMWRQNLEAQLLWRRLEIPGEVCSRARQYIAPTWSWASTDGPVATTMPRHSQSELKVHIKNVHLIYETEDTTGQIRGGYLDLQRELKPMSLVPASTEGVQAVVRNVTKAMHDCFFDALGYMERALRDSSQNRLFYMTFLVTEEFSMSMLLRVVDIEAGTFERLGVWRLWFTRPQPEHDEFAAAVLIELDETTKKELLCLRYEGGKHAIRII